MSSHTGRKNRRRLFRAGNPNIRLASRDDVALFMHAYRIKNDQEPDQEYRDYIEGHLSMWDTLRVVEDTNAAFGGGMCPVGLFKAMFNEWTLEPLADVG